MITPRLERLYDAPRALDVRVYAAMEMRVYADITGVSLSGAALG
ncbi:hypothetical protein [Streptomyces sp. MS2.AVA.5]|uniref:Uncharacterized protein n=1 Tax=Streptomyces achmelvichensis TaxID=3134111 RepID=A0ACC6Q8W5_9ACTN